MGPTLSFHGEEEWGSGRKEDLLKVTVVMKAELGPDPGVSLGPSSEFFHACRLAKEEAEKGVQYTSVPTATISTFPSPNWTTPMTPTCPKEKARKSQRLGTEPHSPRENMRCSVPGLVWAIHGHLRTPAKQREPRKKWLPLPAWWDRLATPGGGLCGALPRLNFLKIKAAYNGHDRQRKRCHAGS